MTAYGVPNANLQMQLHVRFCLAAPQYDSRLSRYAVREDISLRSLLHRCPAMYLLVWEIQMLMQA